MASLFESDFRTSSSFPPHHQIPDQKEMEHITSPYFLLQSGGGDPASFQEYFPQTTFMNSLQHVTSEYDFFVKGVVSDVLLRVEEQTPSARAMTPPYNIATPPHGSSTENMSLPTQYHPHHQQPAPVPVISGEDCDDHHLMWGSDLSFGPNGFRPLPNAPPSPPIDKELVYIYTKSLVPLSQHAPPPQQGANNVPETTEFPESLSPSPSPSPTTTMRTRQVKHDEATPDLTELNRGGIQRITGKKRRRLLHIIAERNRRLNQNKMYEELYRLVPGLEHSARSTKREVLTKTADWLEDLVEENKRLEEQLRQLPSCPPPVQESGPGHGRG
ncbi:hypothetical protein BJY01DRAFT_255076 [Aspergillus pseudoustus]|uniref:BHLH domain-containing protein n=1 Tax=Aspergillus pseudoustus TaxID=1810923 RepID=A0ABR4INH7_9EURO